MTDPPLPASGALRAPLLGALWWGGAVAVSAAGFGDLTLVDAMLLLAVSVIVPAAVPLHPAASLRAGSLATVAGLPVAVALLSERGVVAAALVLPWIVVACVGTVASTRWWWATDHRVRETVWPAAATYLAVGTLWLFADRLGLEPGGFAAPFVQLTAIHFHYAGFASAVLAGCVLRWCPGSSTAAFAAALIVGGPAVVAAGFAYAGMLQIVGAALLTLGLWLLAWVSVRHVAPQAGKPAGVLLVVSSIAVLAPMVLAVQWAVGANFGTRALSIPAMVRIHGVTNALGFTLLGVTGWRMALDRAGQRR